MTSDSQPEAIQRAQHQLEMLLKPGGSGGAFCIQDELATCWASLKTDPAVADPEAKMTELADWFDKQLRDAIAHEIKTEPIESED